jgi:Lamin Tail Domain
MVALHRRAGVRALLSVVLACGLACGSCARGAPGDASDEDDAPESGSPSADCAIDGAGSPVADPSSVEGGGGAVAPALLYDDAGNVVVAAGDDTGDDASSGTAGDGTAGAGPSVGDLAITEVMLSPSGPEPQSEWFEVYNLTGGPLVLSGITIEDGYGDTHVIASSPSVVLAPYAYALLVRDRAGATQSLVPASAIAYAYGTGVASDEGIELDAADLGELSLWNGDTLLVDVPYGMWTASSLGQSIELGTPQSTADDPHQWCFAESPWANGSDDGTPGARTDCVP